MTLADRIAVFIDGRIVQVGTPREVYARPRTIAVAGFIGTPPMNLLRASWAGDAVDIAGQRHPSPGAPAAGRDVMLGVRPGDLRIAASGLAARVERIEDLGDSSIVSFVMDGRTLKIEGRRTAADQGGRGRPPGLRAGRRAPVRPGHRHQTLTLRASTIETEPT